MILAGQKFVISDTLDSSITVPDCIVKRSNKIGKGNGEAKLYVSPKDNMYEFFGTSGFKVRCFVLKQDLIDYMNAIHAEYLHPTQQYREASEMPKLWLQRLHEISLLPDVIEFDVYDQVQISGVRGYVKSDGRGYDIIREISLPLVSYISVMRLIDSSGATIFYWKLFADFDAISDKRDALVYIYGKKGIEEISKTTKENSRQKEISNARKGQGQYRDRLLAECHYCPITMINDDRLLIASHIKPWAVSSDREKVDHKNGFILSPLYDRLFDKGFMTFTQDRRIVL